MRAKCTVPKEATLHVSTIKQANCHGNDAKWIGTWLSIIICDLIHALVHWSSSTSIFEQHVTLTYRKSLRCILYTSNSPPSLVIAPHWLLTSRETNHLVCLWETLRCDALCTALKAFPSCSPFILCLMNIYNAFRSSFHRWSPARSGSHRDIFRQSTVESFTTFKTIKNVGNPSVASVLRQGYPLLFRWDLPI